MTGIGEKVAYVRAGAHGPTHNHDCHWPGCKRKVPPRMWGCKEHWYQLPKSIRDKIWLNFQPRQEETKTPSREYVAAAREAQEWIAKTHGIQGGLI